MFSQCKEPVKKQLILTLFVVTQLICITDALALISAVPHILHICFITFRRLTLIVYIKSFKY